MEIKLVINGQEKELECENVSELLSGLNLNKDTVAIELNKNIIHRQNFDSAILKNNDKLEIVTVVGGG